MKLKIIFLLLVLLLPRNVYGETVIKHKCYKEEKEYLGVLTKEENVNNYILYDEIKYEYGEWKNYDENVKLLDNVEVKNIYTYKNLDKIKYLFIREIDVYNDPLKIDEIKIYNKEELISYSTMCYGCEPYNLEYFNDNNLENNVGIIRNGSVIINLDKEYNPWDIRLEIYYSETNNEKFFIWLSQYDSASKTPMLEYKESFNKTQQKHMKSYTFDKTMIKNEVYNNQEFNTDSLIDNWYTKLVGSKKLYREVITKYNYYKENKIYLDDNYYEICPTYYINDRDNYITTIKNDKVLEKNNIVKSTSILSEIIPNKEKANIESLTIKTKKTENKKTDKYIKNNETNDNVINKDDNIKVKADKIVKVKKRGKITMPIIITIFLLGLSAIIIKFKL